MLKPAKGSILISKNMHLWHSFSGAGGGSKRIAFECPSKGCGAMVLGVRAGAQQAHADLSPCKADGYFGICLHCNSAFVVLVDTEVDEYYMRNLRDILDPDMVDGMVAEIKSRMAEGVAVDA
jgi:hypothetical protein